MSRRLFWVMMAIVAGITACEPLAPEPNSQAIVIITNTPTEGPQATLSPTPLLASRTPEPTLTPTIASSPTPTVQPCTEEEGQVIDSVFQSQIAGRLIDYRMVQPPCFYTSGRRYPYVILLHGSGFDYTEWTDGVGIDETLDAALQDPTSGIGPMVLIMPDGGEFSELNQFNEGRSYEDIILNELIPEVESNFCLWNEPDGRAIGGISRGGFWAFSIALRWPESFRSVGGHSAFFTEDNAPPSRNPLTLVGNLQWNTPLRIYLDHAQNDAGGPNIIRFADVLQTNNVQFTYEISATGGHNNEYWASKSEDYLRFYGAVWPKFVEELPTCY